MGTDLIQRQPLVSDTGTGALPHNIEAEENVLGAMILDPDAATKVADIVEAKDFFIEGNQVIFDVITDLNGRGVGVDQVTLAGALADRGKLEIVGGRDGIRGLIRKATSLENVGSYAEIVLNKSVLRSLVRASDEIRAQAIDGARADDGDAFALVDRAESALEKIADRRNVADVTPLFNPVQSLYDTAMYRRAHPEEAVSLGVPTGFLELDRLMRGLRPGLILVAARPSMGKTSLCMNIATHAALTTRKTSLFFSMEMGPEELAMRVLQGEAHVDSEDLETGRLADTEVARMDAAMARLDGIPLLIDSRSTLTPMEIRRTARKYRNHGEGLGLIVVDYVGMMSMGGRYDNRTQEVDVIARMLKSIAQEFQVPVLALSQLSRAVEKREDKRPLLADLRESGGLEAAADVVMFIYRDDYYLHKKFEEDDRPEEEGDDPIDRYLEGGSKGSHDAEIIVAKNRNGGKGVVTLTFTPCYSAFSDRVADDAEWPMAA